MAIIPRQTGLLSAENWKKVYQTFREADFTAYDFETLRKTMIDYVKRNYPEDFNDYTESSEFIALIDLIAFFGQSLAFRADMNARENFIDTAERRDSILKLARLVSYNPKRNISAHGYLKIDSISTTEQILDSDGNDLSSLVVNWADASNENWLEQFTAILNSCMVSTQRIGRPGNRATINGIRTEEYGINITRNVIPVYRFTGAVDNQDMIFEIVSATALGKTFVYEQAPDIGKAFNILYMNDSMGNSSDGTGYFMYFKQGELKNIDFTIDEVVPNKVINIDSNNINDSDVWLYSLDSANRTDSLWNSVPAVTGVNVIYNSQDDKNLYQVNSRVNDQISLVFGDGVFTNIPSGSFRLYYRSSNGLTYKITPDELQGVEISLDYVSRRNRVETVTLRASLRYTVTNASARETADAIKQKAPQQYYTQNRMITGEDYNILPYTNYSSIVKVKAVNRTSSGLSRYLDVLDTTGKYSSTNVFGSDGVLYRENITDSFTFTFNNRSDIQKVLFNQIEGDILRSRETLHRYYNTVVLQTFTPVAIPAQEMIEGETYTIYTTGTTNYLEYGASTNSINNQFVAVNVGRKNYFYTVTNLTVSNRVVYNFSNNLNPYNPVIRLKVGDILRLDVAAPGNPLWIKKFATTGIDDSVVDVINNGTENGVIEWNTTNAIGTFQNSVTYYYVSQYNASISGQIIVSNYGDGQVKTNISWNLSSIGDSSATGYFMINRRPIPLSKNSEYNNFSFVEVGALVKFVSPDNYHFNSTNNIVPGPAKNPDDKTELFAAIMSVRGDGYNNGQGNFSNGQGPITVNQKIPNGAIAHSVIPKFNNQLPESVRGKMIDLIGNYSSFGLKYVADTILKSPSLGYDVILPNWVTVESGLEYDQNIYVLFEYNSVAKNYLVKNRQLRYVFHSSNETNFFYDRSLQVYDSFNNSTIKDHIKILKNNVVLDADTKLPVSLTRDFIWEVHKEVRRNDGFIENKSIYVTLADTNDDGIPDDPFLFENIVGSESKSSVTMILPANWATLLTSQKIRWYNDNQIGEDVLLANGISKSDIAVLRVNGYTGKTTTVTENNPVLTTFTTGENFIFFELIESRYDRYKTWRLLDIDEVITSYSVITAALPVIRNYDVGQLFFASTTKEFYKVQLNSSRQKVFSLPLNVIAGTERYKWELGIQNVNFQYRHNSPNTHRVDPNISNIVDVYVLNSAYNQSYRQYIQDITGRIPEPVPPTSTELQIDYSGLEKYKPISDTMVFHSAVFKPLFGPKADMTLQAVFKVIKNPNLSLSDTDVKSSVINAVNTYFSIENWDFGEIFYFSELAAYLHKELTPKVASIVIVPRDPDVNFGELYQINSEPNEIIISAATVNDVEIISSINASQLNQSLANTNRSIGI